MTCIYHYNRRAFDIFAGGLVDSHPAIMLGLCLYCGTWVDSGTLVRWIQKRMKSRQSLLLLSRWHLKVLCSPLMPSAPKKNC